MSNRDGQNRECERDHQLLKALSSATDEERDSAARELFERYYERIIAGLLSAYPDLRPADAEECASDSLLRLFQDPSKYDPELGGLLTYLFLNAKHRAVDRFRKAKGWTRVPLRDWAAPEPSDTPPVRPRSHDDRVKRLRAAVRDLPPASRASMQLRLQGVPISEIAERLGCQVGAVHTRLSRARKTLKRRLTGS